MPAAACAGRHPGLRQPDPGAAAARGRASRSTRGRGAGRRGRHARCAAGRRRAGRGRGRGAGRAEGRAGRGRAPDEAIVLGADQMLEVDGDWLGKPASRGGARPSCSGCAAAGTGWSSGGRGVPRRQPHLAPCRRRAALAAPVRRRLPRPLSGGCRRGVLGCVGAYQIEGLGAQLMARVEGDFFTDPGPAAAAAAAVPARPGRAGDVIVLGLTGSIAMGKSRAARPASAPLACRCSMPTPQVHALIAPGRRGAWRAVAAAFPGCLRPAAAIDRQAAGPHGVGPAGALRRLEAIVHPLVRAAERRVPRRALPRRRPARRPRHAAAARDRRRAARRRVAVVCASPMLQAQRGLRRPGMTADEARPIRRRSVRAGSQARRLASAD